MLKNRILALAAGIGALAVGVSALPAAAAADISRPGSCSLSANWQVNITANFNNTSGSPSRGLLDYLVLSSPGALDQSVGSGHSAASAYDVNGNTVWLAGDDGGSWVRDTSKPGFVYRLSPDPDEPAVRQVRINPRSNTGVQCSDYSSYSAIFSAN